MKNVIALVLVLLMPTYAYAAACVSQGSGGWNVAGTWLCGGAPGVPTAADTVSIGAGHTVTIDGNATAGAAPASNTTYNIDISGTLYWPNAPGADWTFTAVSSIRINVGGILQIADSGTPLNSANRAYFYFDNTPANQKYKIYVNGGSLDVYGNSAYFSSTGVTRARILSCNPNCNAGAGITVTLDQNVNWTASASATHDAVLVGTGGNITAPAAGDDPELITTWTSPAANQIGNVTFTENHMAGDIVVNVSRNVLFQSDSTTYHSYIESIAANDPYDLNWIRLDEFGDTNFAPGTAISFGSTNHTLGTLYGVAATNIDDGGSSDGFEVTARGWTKFEENVAHDAGVRAFEFGGSTYNTTQQVIKNCSYFGPPSASTQTMYIASVLKLQVDGLWSSHSKYGVYSPNTPTEVINSIIHHTIEGGSGVSMGRGSSFNSLIYNKVSNTEIRNAGGYGLYLNTGTYYLYGNDFDNVAASCVYVPAASSIYSDSNTYDNCNANNSASNSGVRLYVSSVGTYRGYNEQFGSTNPNLRSNLMFYPYASYATGASRRFSAACNYCLFAAPTGALTCGVMPNDGIFIEYCHLGSTYATFLDDEVYFTMHNKDQVSGTHIGWGPGGTVISRETGTVVDNTLNLKLQPGDATTYSYIKIGGVYVTAGQTLTVTVQLRKDEAMATDGTRPRLALHGNGFRRDEDYDELSDVVDTWETQTVTGVVAFTGTVDLYIAVKNSLSGVDAYTPVWPPTLEIYADALAAVKTGP